MRNGWKIAKGAEIMSSLMQTPEQMYQATKTHRIYLQDADGNLYPSQFRAMYTPEGAGRICGTMNAGYPADGLKYVHGAYMPVLPDGRR